MGRHAKAKQELGLDAFWSTYKKRDSECHAQLLEAFKQLGRDLGHSDLVNSGKSTEQVEQAVVRYSVWDHQRYDNGYHELGHQVGTFDQKDCRLTAR